MPGNDRTAIEAAAEAGLGIETDIRDAAAGICVSHDVPESAHVLPMACLLEVWSTATADPGILALNVKSDGLVPLLLKADRDWTERECFFFDMSVPELLQYARVGLPVAVRLSEFETWDQALVNALHQRPSVWLDSFTCDWFLSKAAVEGPWEDSFVGVVSPEIHGRDPRWVWDWIWDRHDGGSNVGVCTDRPLEFLGWGSGH